MLEKLQIIRELSALFSGVDIYLAPDSLPELSAFLQENLSPQVKTDLSHHPALQQICSLDSDFVYEFLPYPGIQTLVYHWIDRKKILLVGPVTTEGYSAHNLLAYLQQHNLSQNATTQFMETASRLPSVPSTTLYRLMDILLKHLCKLQFPMPVRKIESDYAIAPVSLFNDNLTNDIRHIRQIEDRYQTSSALTEAVKLGNLSLALQTMQSSGQNFDLISRSKSPLRNMQNQCIMLNTQLRHSLEGCGIHPFDLDHLSNEIGIQIERLSSTEMGITFSTYIIEQYCRLVQEQSFQNLSPLTHQTVIYLKNNLHANLTVKDTAKELSVHPDYLSRQFSKEMGMTFIAFLNHERCKQAASFLKHTNLQIKQISAIVGFNTISYFTKQFSQFYGKTPRDFRNERIFHHSNKHTEYRTKET